MCKAIKLGLQTTNFFSQFSCLQVTVLIILWVLFSSFMCTCGKFVKNARLLSLSFPKHLTTLLHCNIAMSKFLCQKKRKKPLSLSNVPLLFSTQDSHLFLVKFFGKQSIVPFNANEFFGNSLHVDMKLENNTRQ